MPLLLDKYTLFLNNEILLEYEEKLQSNFSIDISSNFINLLFKQKNIRRKQVYFRLNLVSTDPDDNKFADCAFACNAHFLVSNDKHLLQLNNSNFPVFNVLKAAEFLKLLEEIA